MKHVFYYKNRKSNIIDFIVNTSLIFTLIIFRFSDRFKNDFINDSDLRIKSIGFFIEFAIIITILMLISKLFTIVVRWIMIKRKWEGLKFENAVITIRSALTTRKIPIDLVESVLLKHELNTRSEAFLRERFVVTFKYKNGKQFKLDMDQFDGANTEVLQNIFREYNIPIHT